MSKLDTGREYAVIVWHPNTGSRFAGPGFGPSWGTDYDAVLAHYEWCTTELRAEQERLAQENEESGFDGGNQAWYSWNNKFDGKKDNRYAIISRPVPDDWTFEIKEEGFKP